MSLSVLLLVPLLSSPEVSAQIEIELERIPLCDCGLVATEMARLGERDGSGIIESQQVRLTHHPSDSLVVVWQIGGHGLQLFTSSGRFIRAFGREGQGPGDISRLVSVAFSPAGTILVLDFGRLSLLELSLHGEELRAVRMPIPAGRLKPLGPDSLVIASVDRNPDRAGYPLHLLTVSDGTVSSFGSDGEYSILDPFGGSILLGDSSGSSTVWWASVGRFHFEGWDPRGQVLRHRVSGDPPWWDKESYAVGFDAPRTLVISFAVDDEGRLWAVTRVPDPDWENVETQTEERLVMPDQYDGFWNTRVDAYDTKSGVHLGSMNHDAATLRVFVRRGQPYLSVVEDTDPFLPQVVVYELTPGR